jgi:hypothetical protein
VQATLDRVQPKGIELNETLDIGGDLVVRRLGYGAMRLTGRGIWGDPHDPAAARAVLLHRSPVTVAIPGTSSLEHLEENMEALGIRLTSAERSALDELDLGRP